MRKWDSEKPIMSSAAILKSYRDQLWNEIVKNPQYSSQKVNDLLNQIRELTKRINRRVITVTEANRLVYMLKKQKLNYKRVTKKTGLSRRSIKFILKRKKKDGKKESR